MNGLTYYIQPLAFPKGHLSTQEVTCKSCAPSVRSVRYPLLDETAHMFENRKAYLNMPYCGPSASAQAIGMLLPSTFVICQGSLCKVFFMKPTCEPQPQELTSLLIRDEQMMRLDLQVTVLFPVLDQSYKPPCTLRSIIGRCAFSSRHQGGSTCCPLCIQFSCYLRPLQQFIHPSAHSSPQQTLQTPPDLPLFDSSTFFVHVTSHKFQYSKWQQTTASSWRYPSECHPPSRFRTPKRH